jgi:hypothetical protein
MPQSAVYVQPTAPAPAYICAEDDDTKNAKNAAFKSGPVARALPQLGVAALP